MQLEPMFENANKNIVFTKLASQLNAEKLTDLAIIPAIFLVQTLISWVVAILVAQVFRFNKRASNFVTAMGVFGNSNSLPISLVLSLSQTIKGLHWDRIPGDNDDEVGARGILYLLIFQQLGQLVRWSWGYHVLLAPKEKYEEYQDEITEEGSQRHDQEAHDEHETEPLVSGLDGETEGYNDDQSIDSQIYEPAGRTPVAGASHSSLAELNRSDDSLSKSLSKRPTALSGNNPALNGAETNMLSFPRIINEDDADEPEVEEDGFVARHKARVRRKLASGKRKIKGSLSKSYDKLPEPVKKTLSFCGRVWEKVMNFIWEFMNPPLWAMLIAVVVASVPSLQKLFFEDESFVNNSVTSAIASSGGVAVPLILVVLGANLARNTMAKEDEVIDPEEEVIGTKLMVASLISRMVLPTAIMAPILALTAKYINVSILDDPIFIIVCFLLSGAPSALQLAQICQINGVFEKTMGRLLFQSYVIW